MSIEDYLQRLLDVLAESSYVASCDIALDKRSPDAGLIRGDIYFIDNSHLHFRELVDVESKPLRLYSYHYQRSDSSLVFRYDDTPHYPNLASFPHHKHERAENNVVTADPPDLPAVLREIEAQMQPE